MQNSSSNNSDDHLLDEDITLVPNTLSPTSFSSQVSQRLGIRSFTRRRADAAIPSNNKKFLVNSHLLAVYNTTVSPSSDSCS